MVCLALLDGTLMPPREGQEGLYAGKWEYQEVGKIEGMGVAVKEG